MRAQPLLSVVNPGNLLRNLVPALILDFALPPLTYLSLTHYVPSLPSSIALGLGGIFPFTSILLGLIRHKYPDVIGLLILMGLVLSVLGSFLPGDLRLLITRRETLITGADGLVCLLSLFSARPLMYYIVRQLVTGNAPLQRARFNDQATFSHFHFRLVTLLWGIGWFGQAVLRVILMLTLSPVQLLAISSLFTSITVAMVVLTLLYVLYFIFLSSSSPISEQKGV